LNLLLKILFTSYKKKNLKITLLVIFIYSSINCKAQNDSINDGFFGTKNKWDTLKYEKFNYVLIVGFFQQYRNFENKITQTINVDSLNLSSTPLLAKSKLISGLVFNYDKFQIQFGFGGKKQNDTLKTPESKMLNLGFSFGDNRWVIDTYFRRFKTFYNNNSSSIDSVNRKHNTYIVSPNMVSNLILVRASYFTNYNKYSYKAGYGCNFRQRKSAASWILNGGITNYQIKNDTSFFAGPSQKYYNEYSKLNYINAFNVGVGGGAALSIVLFKAWFVNALGTLGPDVQFRKYNLNPGIRNITAISWSGLFRVSFGLNLKKLYIISTYSSDFMLINNSVLKNNSQAVTVSFLLGWRFNTGAPKPFYQKFQKSKIYNMF